MIPYRVQMRRTKGWRMPPGTVIVDRRSPYGNPYRIGWDAVDAADAVAQFALDLSLAKRNLLHTRQDKLYVWRRQPRGVARAFWIVENVWRLKNWRLACWCKLGRPCHADVLYHLAQLSEMPVSNAPLPLLEEKE